MPSNKLCFNPFFFKYPKLQRFDSIVIRILGLSRKFLTLIRQFVIDWMGTYTGFSESEVQAVAALIRGQFQMSIIQANVGLDKK